MLWKPAFHYIYNVVHVKSHYIHYASEDCNCGIHVGSIYLGLSYVYTVYQVLFSSVAALYNNLYEVHIDRNNKMKLAIWKQEASSLKSRYINCITNCLVSSSIYCRPESARSNYKTTAGVIETRTKVTIIDGFCLSHIYLQEEKRGDQPATWRPSYIFCFIFLMYLCLSIYIVYIYYFNII